MEAIIMLVLMFAIVYFLLIRPQQKRQKQIREMHSNLQKGDNVITIGGLHGTIDAIDEDKIVLLVHDSRKLTYDRSAVREVINQN
ncbi:preprotein translocase subunit YajC [Salicibibacter kimchii]|uniref:Preprotein translocase subunit YajC n=1 Tax=Salicibibacter kimchii TaxID=2099786 RepID=A0A345C3G7_9BACI|nr:preprotein translocase subunit YajC [Salicibibacter kimchii]AXF57748.1 preprotein translocase subunit YajC [Salicibibacter kimchii]